MTGRTIIIREHANTITNAQMVCLAPSGALLRDQPGADRGHRHTILELLHDVVPVRLDSPATSPCRTRALHNSRNHPAIRCTHTASPAGGPARHQAPPPAPGPGLPQFINKPMGGRRAGPALNRLPAAPPLRTGR